MLIPSGSSCPWDSEVGFLQPTDAYRSEGCRKDNVGFLIWFGSVDDFKQKFPKISGRVMLLDGTALCVVLIFFSLTPSSSLVSL